MVDSVKRLVKDTDGNSATSVLFDEIMNELTFHGKTLQDIDWVECSDFGENGMRRFEIPLENFIEAAKNTKWDENRWWRQMTDHLLIYGKERSFLIRIDDYDGSQSVEYIDMAVSKPQDMRTVESFNVIDDSENPQWSDTVDTEKEIWYNTHHRKTK